MLAASIESSGEIVCTRFVIIVRTGCPPTSSSAFFASSHPISSRKGISIISSGLGSHRLRSCDGISSSFNTSDSVTIPPIWSPSITGMPLMLCCFSVAAAVRMASLIWQVMTWSCITSLTFILWVSWFIMCISFGGAIKLAFRTSFLKHTTSQALRYFE